MSRVRRQKQATRLREARLPSPCSFLVSFIILDIRIIGVDALLYYIDNLENLAVIDKVSTLQSR